MAMVVADTGCHRRERLRQQGPTAPGASDRIGDQCQRAGRGSQCVVAPTMMSRVDFWTATMIRQSSPQQRPHPLARRTTPIPTDGQKEPCHARYRD